MLQELELVKQQSSHLQAQVNELNEVNERLAGENQMLKSELNEAHQQVANLQYQVNNGPVAAEHVPAESTNEH